VSVAVPMPAQSVEAAEQEPVRKAS
jgi:hypothetical protein